MLCLISSFFSFSNKQNCFNSIDFHKIETLISQNAIVNVIVFVFLFKYSDFVLFFFKEISYNNEKKKNIMMKRSIAVKYLAIQLVLILNRHFALIIVFFFHRTFFWLRSLAMNTQSIWRRSLFRTISSDSSMYLLLFFIAYARIHAYCTLVHIRTVLCWYCWLCV